MPRRSSARSPEMQASLGLLRYASTARALRRRLLAPVSRGRSQGAAHREAARLRHDEAAFSRAARRRPPTSASCTRSLHEWAQRTALFAASAASATRRSTSTSSSSGGRISWSAPRPPRCSRASSNISSRTVSPRLSKPPGPRWRAMCRASFELLRDWVRGYLANDSHAERPRVFRGSRRAASAQSRARARRSSKPRSSATVEGLAGSHPLIRSGPPAPPFRAFPAKAPRARGRRRAGFRRATRR